MSFIEKLTRIVFLICCILFTSAFIFDVVKSNTHRKYVESKLRDIEDRGIGIDSDLNLVLYDLNEIKSSLSTINRQLR
jgi:hypothetical protein